VSEEQVQIGTRAIRAFNEHDVEGCQALFASDAEIVPLRAALEGTVFSGPDAVARFFEASDETWQTISVEVERVREAEAAVVFEGRLVGQGRGSGAKVDGPITWVLTFDGDKIKTFRSYRNRNEGLKASGLSG
jgi:ketosteroid isomerase-like protein